MILYLMHILPLHNFLQSWLTWYIGDSIGVLIFTPIFLIIFAKPYEVWHSRIMPILIPLSICFLVVSLAYASVRSNVELAGQLWFVMVCALLFCVLVNITLFIIHGQKNIIQLKMNEILRSAGEVIFSVDAHEKIMFANPAAERMWNCRESDFIGKSIHEYIDNANELGIDEHDRKCPVRNAFKYNKTTQVTNKLLFRFRDPSIWIEYICTPLIISGKTIGTVIILNDITTRRESEFHLERLAHYDILTGAPNRFSFIEKLTNSIVNISDGNENLTVCFLDLDNFKFVNDNLGHATGDIVLQNISQMIAENIDHSDYFARLGGDEFGIILHNKENVQSVNHFIERLIDVIGTPITVKQSEITLSISVGIATFPVAGMTADELIKNADIAMYRAKESGKNTYAHFNAELSKAISRIHLIGTELQHAILRNELSLVYQPQITTGTNKICGVEVLLRWTSPLLGSVSPAEFIPIAERNGMIHPIGEWIFRQLACEYAEIAALAADDFTISMNVSVLQLGDSRFYNGLLKILNSTQLDNKLILEITRNRINDESKRNNRSDDSY